MSLSIVILAAGKGTRMKSATPKVLHAVAGRPMLGHVIAESQKLNPENIVVVYSHEDVKTYAESFEGVTCVLQEEQLGTGHAARMAEPVLKSFNGDVMILMGDCPLMDAELMERFHASHVAQENVVTFISVFAEDPTGLGRVVRDGADNLQAIVEHKDASQEQLSIDEVNTGVYLVKSQQLFAMLAQLNNSNAQGEYYLTDIVEWVLSKGENAGTFTFEEPEALSGVNSRLQLAMVEDYYQNRKRESMMAKGVTMLDPQSVYFAYDTEIEADVELGPNVRFGAGVKIGSGTVIEGNLYAENLVTGNVLIKSFCHLCDVLMKNNSDIGPFARMRGGVVLEEKAHVGNFVEFKKTTLGEGSKCGHHTYLGDTTVGTNVNIGAGTITANYDGKNKFKTVIEDEVFTGSHSTLVAPLTLGVNATVGAGTVVRKNVPEDTLVVGKSDRLEKANYQRPKKDKV